MKEYRYNGPVMEFDRCRCEEYKSVKSAMEAIADLYDFIASMAGGSV